MKQENANKNDTKRAIKNNPAAIEKVRNNPIYNKPYITIILYRTLTRLYNDKYTIYRA